MYFSKKIPILIQWLYNSVSEWSNVACQLYLKFEMKLHSQMGDMRLYKKRVCRFWEWMWKARGKMFAFGKASQPIQYKFYEHRFIWNVQHIWWHCFISYTIRTLFTFMPSKQDVDSDWLHFEEVFIYSHLLSISLSTLSMIFRKFLNAANYKFD